MTQPDPHADYDGCNRRCRLAGAHTLVWGDCEHATPPAATVDMCRVYVDHDGQNSIGFDTYTVDQLAELLDPVLGSQAMRARTGSVDLAHLAAHAIIHRHDPAAAVPPLAEQPTTNPKQPAFDAVFAYIRQQPRDFLPTRIVDRNAMIWHAVHAALDAVLPATDSQAAVRAQAFRDAAEAVRQMDTDPNTRFAADQLSIMAAEESRLVGKAQQDQCSARPCNADAGELCDAHAQQHYHAKGEHTFCGPECNSEAQQNEGQGTRRECPPGVHSIFDPCPGDCGQPLCDDPPARPVRCERAAILLWAADQIDAETQQAKADGVLEPDKYRPCRDASAQLRRLAGEAPQDGEAR